MTTEHKTFNSFCDDVEWGCSINHVESANHHSIPGNVYYYVSKSINLALYLVDKQMRLQEFF